ncbi:MAG: aldehyde dehydrogenase family protein [Dehalococcoidales bacterium]|jgi:acyl-CoA reductase-like NAD-dependent aldehyde dehydrogenase
MDSYKMWIGGEFVDAASGQTYKVVNPATEEEITRLPLGGKEDVAKAVAAAKNAFPVWSKKSQDERTNILNQIAVTMREYIPELAMLDTLDHGTPGKMAVGMMMGGPKQLEWAGQASRALMGEYIPSSRANTAFWLKREPVGVCALIIPWNGPLAMLITKMAQALAVGNTCVIKPPSIDSITSLKFAEILAKCNLPAGTVNIITGPGGTVGEAMATHPDVALVSFTGSCETGKRIMELASKTVKRVSLELGGKNPFIVLADASLDMAVNCAVRCTQMNSGMICASPGRYYIHESLHDSFVEKYVAGAGKWVVGDPNDDKTMMGPVVSAEHRDHIERLVKKGIEEGAKVVLGGQRPTTPPLNKGYYVVPTALTGVTQNMTIAREEIFGPVAVIMKYSDENKVIEMANDNTFGLSASVWTKNAAKGIRFANEINAGAVWINDHMIIGNELPWGGFKESGFGKENHVVGLEEYTQFKLISLDLTE